MGAAKVYLKLDSIHLASRLDRETSGVVLLAKHRKSASTWQKAIEEKRVYRKYIAILRGEMRKSLSLSTYLGNDSNSDVFVKQRVLEQKSKKAKKAQTLFEPFRQLVDTLFVESKLELEGSIKLGLMLSGLDTNWWGKNYMVQMRKFIAIL